MVTTNSFGQTDLSPRRVGIHFRKLACRSDAVDEGQTEERLNGLDFGARARSTGFLHEGEFGPSGGLGGRCLGTSGWVSSVTTASPRLTVKTSAQSTVTTTWENVLA